jgi:hypothetical protein
MLVRANESSQDLESVLVRVLDMVGTNNFRPLLKLMKLNHDVLTQKCSGYYNQGKIGFDLIVLNLIAASARPSFYGVDEFLDALSYAMVEGGGRGRFSFSAPRYEKQLQATLEKAAKEVGDDDWRLQKIRSALLSDELDA